MEAEDRGRLKRKRMRLKAYDYSLPGYYFVTVCTKNREEILGHIAVGQGLCSCSNQSPKCKLSPLGEIVLKQWFEIEKRYPNIQLDRFVVMPNHVHCVIIIKPLQRQEHSPCPTKLGDVICVFKSLTTKLCNERDGVAGRKIWQYRYHDHIIRNAEEYRNICEYIETNPIRWQDDCYYVGCIK